MDRNKLTTSVVAILHKDGSNVGTGFVVSHKGLIVTCAHVITDAGIEPGGTVKVRFEVDHTIEQAGKVDLACWSEPRLADLALIRLDASLPHGVEPVKCGPTTTLEDHPLHGFGYPGTINGERSHSTVLGPIKGRIPFTRLLQLRSNEISSGHSGGPLLEETRGQVVGIVQAIRPVDTDGKGALTAFAIPIETLGLTLVKARMQKPEDLDLLGLTEDISRSLSPRGGWPRLRSIIDVPGDISAMEESLNRCLDTDPSQIQALLLRLPQHVVDSALNEIRSATDRAKISSAILRACARNDRGLSLLASVIYELAIIFDLTASLSPDAKALVADIQRYEGHEYSELDLRRVIAAARAAVGPSQTERLWELAKEFAPQLVRAEFEQIKPLYRHSWVVRCVADLSTGRDGESTLNEFSRRLNRSMDQSPFLLPISGGVPTRYKTISIKATPRPTFNKDIQSISRLIANRITYNGSPWPAEVVRDERKINEGSLTYDEMTCSLSCLLRFDKEGISTDLVCFVRLCSNFYLATGAKFVGLKLQESKSHVLQHIDWEAKFSEKKLVHGLAKALCTLLERTEFPTVETMKRLSSVRIGPPRE